MNPSNPSARTVYEITEQLIDALPDEIRNPMVDALVDGAYENLLRADSLIDTGRNLLKVDVYPHYNPDNTYWAKLESKSDEQRSRLDHHLRYTCLRDSAELEPRKDAALAVINGMLDIYQSRDILFLYLDRHRLSSGERRLLDGIIELSIDYVETMAGVVRPLTRIASSP